MAEFLAIHQTDASLLGCLLRRLAEQAGTEDELWRLRLVDCWWHVLSDPETRKRVGAMMKQQGIDMGGTGGPNKVCYSKEMIERGRWAEQQNDCKTDFSSRSSSSWKWHSSCPKLGSESDGEATFSGNENYVIKTSSVSKLGGTSRTSHMTITGKWMSTECGDLKPLDLKP